MNPQHLQGAATEYEVAAFFLSRGYAVYWPSVAQSRHDFVIQKDGEFKTVQVKSAREEESGPNTYLRVRLEKPDRGTRPYEPGDFDILAVAYRGRVWLIPFDELPSHSSITLEKWGPSTRPWEHDYNPDNWRVR